MKHLPATVLILGLLLAAPAWAHRFFVSLAEAEYDADRGAIEVSLRVDDHNLEAALALRFGREYRLRGNSVGERDARDYVADHFVIATADGRMLDLEWVGWEWSPGMAWLHFEYPFSGDPSKLKLNNSIFLELSDQQVNTVNVRSGGSRHTLTFGRKSRTQNLGLVPDAPVPPVSEGRRPSDTRSF
jgi:hypothetical protein